MPIGGLPSLRLEIPSAGFSCHGRAASKLTDSCLDRLLRAAAATTHFAGHRHVGDDDEAGARIKLAECHSNLGRNGARLPVLDSEL